ncbi:unnamed protein product [Larinioides sclopetarius]|uniref:Uncharacterized protein n=1 Tax=Larinioides sclopetarius TaxID=280406 RepID=A0AAV1ZY17_9ARAC
MACRSLIWVTLCTCVVFCAAIPTRRQFVSITETTSSEPAAVVTNEGAVWDENDDFDLDGDEEWLGDIPASPSSIPQRAEYEDYDVDDGEDDGYSSRRGSKGDAEDEDIDHQDAEEDESDAEFLFMPSRETRLVLQDDDDQSGPIKVRHTGKNSYPEVVDADNSVEDSSKEGRNEDSQNFEFTIDNDEEDDSNNEVDDKDDFVLEDSRPKNLRREADEEDDDDDDDNFVDDEDEEEDPVFENPEEDSQVIYGDHLFLY